MKHANQTPTAEKLQALYNERNAVIKLCKTPQDFDECAELEEINAEIMQTIAEIATIKTLQFLQANNATKSTETETDATRNTNKTFGYDMSVKLSKTFYNDVKLLHNPHNTTDIFSDCADLIQEAIYILVPYITAPVPLSPDDILYTHTQKNGNERSYNAFQLACKAIRSYISNQGTKQYKKLSYIVGFTDEGEQVTTTKRPKNDINDINENSKTQFFSKYGLTPFEQIALFDKLNGKSTTETATANNTSKRTAERALKSAKEKIAKADKRIRP